jgi:hypothetical protein
MRRSLLVLAILAALTAGASGGGLAPPVELTCDGKPIDVDVGHSAPCVADLDGDGLPDLLVGQFGGGKLRIYRNVGEAGKPEFREFTWFQAGGALGTVPSG